MPDIYTNTPIIYDHPEGIDNISMNFQVGYFFGNFVLPLAMVLFVILHFRMDKNQLLYAMLMVILFLFTPSWFTVVSGLVLIGLDKAVRITKPRT